MDRYSAMPVEKRPASAIPVRTFRQIFQWPLFLDPESSAGLEEVRSMFRNTERTLRCEWSAFERRADHAWKPVPDLLDHPPRLDAESDGGGYSEASYFHDFVQSFLYPKGEDGPLRLYRRGDVEAMRFRIGHLVHEFSVERLTMHMVPPAVAMLTLELRWTGARWAETLTPLAGLTLAEAQRVMDHLRRSHPGFWYGDEPARTPQWCELRISGAWGERIEPKSKEEHWRIVEKEGRPPPVFGWWRQLVSPLTLRADGGSWRDPADERIPCNSFISLTDHARPDFAALGQVSEADWARIADAEEPSPPGTIRHPYNAAFFEAFMAKAAYDRFMPSPENPTLAVRHLFGGPHYAMVGAGGFHDHIATHHFRRHYAQLSFIARFQFAQLLELSSRITKAVERRDKALARARRSGWIAERRRKDEARTVFEEEVLALQDEFLTFTHRFRFTGVSSQVQPSEMYDKWRETLGLDALYRDVAQEIETAVAAIRARQQKDAADAATALGRYAAVGVAAGVIVGALGMNVVVGRAWPAFGLAADDDLAKLGWTLAVTAALSLVAGLVINRRVSWKAWAGAVLAAAAGLALAFH